MKQGGRQSERQSGRQSREIHAKQGEIHKKGREGRKGVTNAADKVRDKVEDNKRTNVGDKEGK